MPDRVTNLPESTCLQLLAAGSLGRVAINADPSPLVVPVNYAARSRTIVFVTAAGEKWDAAVAGDPASFQVDGVDPEHRSGWSVLVRGQLAAVDPDDEEVASLLDEVEPLAGGDRPHAVRLDVSQISGRRIPPDAAWARAHSTHHTWTGQDASDLLG